MKYMNIFRFKFFDTFLVVHLICQMHEYKLDYGVRLEHIPYNLAGKVNHVMHLWYF